MKQSSLSVLGGESGVLVFRGKPLMLLLRLQLPAELAAVSRFGASAPLPGIGWAW